MPKFTYPAGQNGLMIPVIVGLDLEHVRRATLRS